MTAIFDYETFVTRNSGYVADGTQEKIRQSGLLIAGCGLGASTAIAATRMGFCKFVLVDGDTVDAHNLNRQFYDFEDIGQPKVLALKRQIQRINPQASVETVHANLDKGNAAELVSKADIVFDTIDFLDLEAVLHLHMAAKAADKPVFTALNIGFGAGVLYFPAGGNTSLPDIISKDLHAAQAQGDTSYAAVFGMIMTRIGKHLDPQVVEQVGKALTIMEDGRPCPASQISVGSFTVAALAVSMMHDMLAGMSVPCAPHMVAHSFRNHVTKLIDISS